MNYTIQAIALRTSAGRWFHNQSKKGRICTAWSLAGARLFSDVSRADLEKAETALKRKGHKPRRVIVGELPVEYFHRQKNIFEDL